VRRAVLEFCGEHSVAVARGADTTWFIRKPAYA
jgi:hypothetical protein